MASYLRLLMTARGRYPSTSHAASWLVTYTGLYRQYLGGWNVHRVRSRASRLYSRPSNPTYKHGLIEPIATLVGKSHCYPISYR